MARRVKKDSLIKNSIKSMPKSKKCSEEYKISEFLMRLNLGANGFGAEIVG